MYVHVHGASCSNVYGYGRVLFVDRRVGDVTHMSSMELLDLLFMMTWLDKILIHICSSILFKFCFCNVPNPPTDEEDATKPSNIRATSPMNMNIHKMMK